MNEVAWRLHFVSFFWTRVMSGYSGYYLHQRNVTSMSNVLNVCKLEKLWHLGCMRAMWMLVWFVFVKLNYFCPDCDVLCVSVQYFVLPIVTLEWWHFWGPELGACEDKKARNYSSNSWRGHCALCCLLYTVCNTFQQSLSQHSAQN